MSYAIEISKSAAKELGKLPHGVRGRIDDAIQTLADDPFPAGAKTLQGQRGVYRIRVGDYRVLYEVVRGRAVVLVIRIGNRREVYR